MPTIERLKDGSYNMVWSGKPPWHHLGHEISNNLTPEEMLTEANLDWQVVKVPLVYEWQSKTHTANQQALIRDSDGAHLTNVSKGWNPNQNHKAFKFFNEFVAAGQMEMCTAGSLNGGRMVWAMAKINDSFTVFGEDRVNSYLLFSNPHEYGKSITILFTPIRDVCWNILSLSLAGRKDLGVRLDHRRPFNAEKVKQTLEMASVKLQEYKDMAEFLGRKRFSQETLTEYLMSVFPTTSNQKKEENELSRAAQVVVDVMDTQPGAEFASGSWWQAFNGVTFVIDHGLGHNDNNRVHSSWYGTNRRRKLTALKTAVKMAEAA